MAEDGRPEETFFRRVSVCGDYVVKSLLWRDSADELTSTSIYSLSYPPFTSLTPTSFSSFLLVELRRSSLFTQSFIVTLDSALFTLEVGRPVTHCHSATKIRPFTIYFWNPL